MVLCLKARKSKSLPGHLISLLFLFFYLLIKASPIGEVFFILNLFWKNRGTEGTIGKYEVIRQEEETPLKKTEQRRSRGDRKKVY